MRIHVFATTSERFACLASVALLLVFSPIAGMAPVTTASAETAAAPVERAGFDLNRPEIAAFVARMVSRDRFTRDEVTAVLAAAHARPELVPAMTRPAEKILAWWEYRDRYVTASRIAGGVEFWQQHAPLLEEIAARHGIPPEYLIAILGIETNYGQVTGTYPEIDTLMTLAFDYPARDTYFRTELRQFLLLSRDLSVDPLSLKGSYGGALGAPQLMPSSYRLFAARAEARHKANLWNDWSLVFASIAEFLVKRGWETDGVPLIDVATVGGKDVGSAGGITLNETAESLRRRGVKIDRRVPGATPAVLIRSVRKDGIGYRVGFRNFRVISRYNPRINYAMAVCDLASEVRDAHAAAADDASARPAGTSPPPT